MTRNSNDADSACLGNVADRRCWPRRPLGEICQLLPSKSICLNGDAEVRAITTACLTETRFDPAGIKTGRMWSSDAANCIVQTGEILIARSNTPELVGRVAMFNGEAPGAVASDLTIRIWPSSEIHGDFLVQYLSALYLSGYWRERAGGASGTMKKITRGQILAELIPVPPIDEQRAVAARLREQLDVVRQGHQAAVAQLKDVGFLRRCLVSTAFSSVFSKPIRESEGVLIQDGTIGSVNNLILADHSEKIGSGSTPSGGHKNYASNGIPLIRSQNVLMRSFSCDGLARITPDIHAQMGGTEVFPGDVLLNITGASIGRVCLVPSELCPANVNQHVSIIRCGKKLDPQFLMLYLSSPAFQKFIDNTQAGGTRQALTKADIETFRIPDLKIQMQRQIAKSLTVQLDAADCMAVAIQNQIEELKIMPRKLLAQIFES